VKTREITIACLVLGILLLANAAFMAFANGHILDGSWPGYWTSVWLGAALGMVLIVIAAVLAYFRR
jgi:hypothetical protein